MTQVHIVDKGVLVTDLPAGDRVFSSAEAVSLAEAYLMEADLQKSLKNMLLVIGKYPLIAGSDDERAIAEALFRDAVVLFIGCFGQGLHELSKETVFAPVRDGLKDFAYLKDMRDTYAAHRFGPARQTFVVVRKTGNEWGFVPMNLLYSVPNVNLLPKFADLVRAAIAAAAAKVAALTPVVQKQLFDIGPDGIERLAPLAARTPDLHELRMSRSAFREGRKVRQRGRKGPKGGKP